MTKPHNDLTAAYVRSILDYNPETGEFRWRTRNDIASSRGRKTWNARFSGKLAGSPNDSGYNIIRIFQKHYRAHRLAWLVMKGEWPKDEIDHENLDPCDTKFRNLREATHSENGFNRRKKSSNKAGLKGVSWGKLDKAWRARITVNGKHLWLGAFDTPEEAHAAYRKAAQELHGQFSNVG